VHLARDLRERTSDHERLNIAAFYEIVVTGNLEAARRSYELIAQTYPRDEAAQILLWYIHLICGDYARADAAAKRAFEINPDSSNNYVSLMYCDQYLGRYDQAKAAAEQSRAKKLNSPWYPLILYVVDFLQNNPAGLAQQAAARDEAQLIISALQGAMLVARPYGDPERFQVAARRLLGTLATA